MTNVHDLDDASLIASLGRIVQEHRRSTTLLIVHLAEMDSRNLHAEQGYSSLYQYCVQVLRFSADEAVRRIEVARLIQAYPPARVQIASGMLSLSVACQLRKLLTPENAEELIAGVSGQSARRAAEWLATKFPRPDVPESFRKLPIPRPVVAMPGQPSASPVVASSATAHLESMLAAGAALTGVAPHPPVSGPVQSMAPPPRSKVEPLSTDRFSLKMTVSRATRDKLERARDLARHRCPDGSLESLFDLALDELIAKLERQRVANVKRPRTSAPPKSLRSLKARAAITASARRDVAARSQCRCEFVSAEGKRCDETAFLEIDHVVPVALGGTSESSNLRHLCRAHNRLVAERALGKEYVRRAIEHARKKTPIRDVADPWRLYRPMKSVAVTIPKTPPRERRYPFTTNCTWDGVGPRERTARVSRPGSRCRGAW